MLKNLFGEEFTPNFRIRKLKMELATSNNKNKKNVHRDLFYRTKYTYVR